MKYIILILVLCSFFNSFATVSIVDSLGVFYLGGPIFADPLSSNDTIVTISSSNVILDIGEHILTQTSTNLQPGLIGIFLEPNLSNVTVRNGTISNISGVGVYISDGCSDIYLQNLSIINCAQTGILYSGTGNGILNGKITNCMVSTCTGTGGNPAYGLRMIGTHNIVISESSFNNNDALLTSSGYGVSLESCNNCKFNQCYALSNGGYQLAAGYSLLNCDDCSFNDCTAIDNITHATILSATTYGYFIQSSTSTSFSNCKATDNSNTNGTGIGFRTINGMGNSFVNCVAQNQQGAVSIGFLSDGIESGDAILNSQSVANSSNFINGITYGILINGPQNCAIASNIVSANIGAQGYGLVDTTTDTNNYIATNLSYANTTTGYSVFRTSGAFPVAYATVGNFSGIENISRYLNVAIVP